MSNRAFLFVFSWCVLAMAIAASPWMPTMFALAVGGAGFVAAVLSTVTVILRLAKKKQQVAGGFFWAGLALLLVACPCSPAVMSLFQPAFPQRATDVNIPVELVFGLLALASIFRAWLIWSAEPERA